METVAWTCHYKAGPGKDTVKQQKIKKFTQYHQSKTHLKYKTKYRGNI